MSKQELRDRQNRLIGTLNTNNNRVIELRNKHNELLGRYDPSTNQTRDKRNYLIGSGNLLSSLLF